MAMVVRMRATACRARGPPPPGTVKTESALFTPPCFHPEHVTTHAKLCQPPATSLGGDCLQVVGHLVVVTVHRAPDFQPLAHFAQVAAIHSIVRAALPVCTDDDRSVKGKGSIPFTRTRGLLAYWRGPISEDARELSGSPEGSNLQAGESTGTCGMMANHTKSITQTLPETESAWPPLGFEPPTTPVEGCWRDRSTTSDLGGNGVGRYAWDRQCAAADAVSDVGLISGSAGS